jgi:hypothetical protein
MTSFVVIVDFYQGQFANCDEASGENLAITRKPESDLRHGYCIKQPQFYLPEHQSATMLSSAAIYTGNSEMSFLISIGLLFG